MKKILVLILVFLFLFTANVALASWWNPISWFNNWTFHKEEVVPQVQVEIQKTSDEKINELQKQINDLKSEQQVPITPVPSKIISTEKETTSPVVITPVQNNSVQSPISPPTQKQIDQLMDYCTLNQTTKNLCTKDNGLLITGFYTNIAFRSLIDQALSDFYQKLSEQQKQVRKQEVSEQKLQIECLLQNPFTEEELKFLSPQAQQSMREARCGTSTPQSDLNYKLYQQQQYTECLLKSSLTSCSYLKPIFY